MRLRTPHNIISKPLARFFLLLIWVSFLCLIRLSPISFFLLNLYATLSDCQIRVNGLSRALWLDRGIREVSWKMVCGIEEINIWETTSRICRSNESTCSYYPFYFVMGVAIFRFFPTPPSYSLLTSKISPYPSLHCNQRACTNTRAQYRFQTPSSTLRYYAHQVHV